ncbi:hypothetical protein Tco_0885532, partial [Tanacetum coccineum]
NEQITPVPSTSRALAPPKPSPLQGSSVAEFSTAKGGLDFDGSEMTPSDIPTSDENENTTGSPSEDDAFEIVRHNMPGFGYGPHGRCVNV